MARKILSFAACAVLSLVASKMSANTYYVATSGGSNDNDGLTPATAWADVWHAVDQASDHDTILLGDGTHYFPSATSENLLVTNAITIQSVNGPTACRIRGHYWKTASSTAQRGKRVLNLNHRDAVFAGITIYDAKDGDTGGGAYVQAGTMTNCIVRGCSVFGYGGGVRQSGGLITCCVISNNTGSAGHQQAVGVNMSGGTLENCLIADNRLTVNGGNSQKGGGIFVNGANCVVRNCTVVKNKALRGAGIYINNSSAKVSNCISYGNIATVSGTDTSAAAPNFYGSCKTTNICTTAAIGTVVLDGQVVTSDALVGDPGFVDFAGGDYRLASGSRCLDKAYGSVSCEVDLDGNPRVSNGTMDIGCYELQQEGLKDVIISFTAESTIGTNRVSFSASGVGIALVDADCLWTFDGREPTAADHDGVGTSFSAVLPPGVWLPRMKTTVGGVAYDKETPSENALVLSSLKIFLKPSNPNARFPYDTWEIAATNVESAYSIVTEGTVVQFAPGTYHLYKGASLPVACTNVAVDGNPANTIIQAHSCGIFELLANSLVDGFTFRNGSGFAGNGGAVKMRAGTVRNCIVENCTASYGCGVSISGGLLQRCIVRGCHIYQFDAAQGAGVSASGSAVIDNCLIYGNFFQPTATSTTTLGTGGGIWIGEGNVTVRNCTIAGNRATNGAGIYLAKTGSRIINTISYTNISYAASASATTASNLSGLSAIITNLCSSSAVGVVMDGAVLAADQTKLAADPLFRDVATGDFRLLCRESPCVNMAFGPATVELDLAGKKRVSGGRQDVGCYEFQENGLFLYLK